MPYLEFGKIDEATEKRLTKIIGNKSFRSYWKKREYLTLLFLLLF